MNLQIICQNIHSLKLSMMNNSLEVLSAKSLLETSGPIIALDIGVDLSTNVATSQYLLVLSLVNGSIIHLGSAVS